MSFVEAAGFFADYYLNLRNSIDNFDAEVEKIKLCQSDLERVEFLENIKGVKEHDANLAICRDYQGKTFATAADYKEKGNVAFKSKRWLEAMVLYTKSYIAAPEDKALEKGIILANRSASLYHMEKYDETLIDIKRSLDYDYPKDLRYKLYERQARCYLAKKDYPNTIHCFNCMHITPNKKNARHLMGIAGAKTHQSFYQLIRGNMEKLIKFITALDEAPLVKSDKRSKMILDAMTMIKMLERDPRTNKQIEFQKKNGICSEMIPTLSIPDECELLSPSIRIDESRQEGRFARAAADIQVGEEILVEHPFVAVLLEKFSKSHCEHCFIRTLIPVACPKCVDVVYCSEKCQRAAAASYHKYECGLLATIWRSGASINCHMALRIFAMKTLEEFLQVADKVNGKMHIEQIQKLPKDDYRRVSHLVKHEGTRSASNFFQHTLMARFLTKCLLKADYFGENAKQEDVFKIEALALRNLQFLQFNTHEVAELHKSSKEGSEKTLFIGGALYPNLALFNHSCDPSVVRYFRGTTIHISAIKPIEAGLQISENYGPIYTQEERSARQSKLLDLYKFECCCDACLEDWPTFDKLPTDVIRFRCDAPNKCAAVIEVPPSCNDFIVKCSKCLECTNILKGLKVMQDTEMMTRTAKRLYDTGDYSKALNKYIDLIKIMHEVLVPPFPDFAQCQQCLKDCFLHFGNFYSMT